MKNGWNPFSRRAKRVGLALATAGVVQVLIGLAFAFSPLLIARLSTPAGGNMYSEGSGGGSAIWLMFLTIPGGAAVCIQGLVTLILGIVSTMRMALPTLEEDAVERKRVLSHRAIAMVLLLPTSLLTTPLLSFMFGNAVFGLGAGRGFFVYSVCVALQLVAAGFAIYFAIMSKRNVLLAILSGVVLLSLIGSYFEYFWVQQYV